MALIKCPECGKEVSSKAQSCPNCGNPFNIQRYGTELGTGVKEGLKGLNTVASPMKRKKCIMLIIVPLVFFILFFGVGMAIDNDTVAGIGILSGLCLGLYQFYVGKVKKGIVYSITMGLFIIGALFDLFRLLIKSFKDNNGFPLIY